MTAAKPLTTFQWRRRLNSLADTLALAPDLAALWRPPAAVLLTGDLGSGKTTLVQAVCAAWGVQDAVKSPTFDLVHCYAGREWTIYHADLYRIGTAEELAALDLPTGDEGDVVTLIEWGGRAAFMYPQHFACRLDIVSGDQRELVIDGVGQEPASRLARWRGEVRHGI